MSKLRKNIFSGLGKQIVAIIYGFILPRLILSHYGSDVNGLVSSITQFLQMISYLDLGMATVVQSALYIPLARNDSEAISEVLTSARKFFRTIAKILLVYVAILLIVYPYSVKNNYSFIYVAVIILALSINSFSQYYFGIVNTTLLRADQKSYIYECLSIAAYLINIVVGVFVIKMNGNIQTLEVATAVVYSLRPLLISFYVRNHYQINYNIKYDEEPIKQKWNGIAQHFSAIVIDSTDVVVLTVFSTFQNVSIYSVYNLVVTGVRTLVLSTTHGMAAHFGNLIARGDRDKLLKSFKKMDWVVNTVSLIVFGCTSILIIPFVGLYTRGVHDANYYVPEFALFLTLAQMFRCMRLPYNILILAAGHYRQTQSNYIIASLINIFTSVFLVNRFGLIGVAIGTLIAFIYQDIWMAFYISKNIAYWPFSNFIKQNMINIVIAVLAYALSKSIPAKVDSIQIWIVYAIVTFGIWVASSIIINTVFYRDSILELLNEIYNKIK